MLILPKRKSTFNFYESFSDLVFCALVMFLVLVLFLAMNVNQKQEQVEVDLEEVSKSLVEAEQAADIARQEAAVIRGKAEQEAQQARQALEENQRLRIEALKLRDTELAEIEKERQKIIADAQKLMALEREQIIKDREKLEAERSKIIADAEQLMALERAKIAQAREAIDAEQKKIDAEQARVAAELKKIQAEQAKVETEQGKIEVDQAKVEAEQKKLLAEQAKVVAEQKRVAAEQARIQAEREKVLAERDKMLAEQTKVEAALNERRTNLQKMETDLDRQRRLYEQALGVNRFMGLPSTPRLVVAYDWQPTRLAVHPVPAWLVEALNTTPTGLDPTALSGYYAKQRAVFLEIAKQVEPLNPAQYRALIQSISVGREPVPSIGAETQLGLDLVFVADEQGLASTQVAIVIPGGNGDKAGIQKDDVLIAIDQQAITQLALPNLMRGYKPGDKARLLVRRAGKPKTLDLMFGDNRLVELNEAYRTDLSMVVTGALDTDYTYLWEPAQADALRSRLQDGRAAAVLWQEASPWDDRVATTGRPVLTFDATADGQSVVIRGQTFTLNQFRRVLESIGGGSIVVEYQPTDGPAELPDAIYENALRPTGFVVRAPQLDKLIRDAE